MRERIERRCDNCGETKRCLKGTRVCDSCASRIAAAIAEQYRGLLRADRPRHASARERTSETKYGGDHESSSSHR